ncbi:MAG: alpha/beta hydrolase [Siculibacillus sp.]|nr:alpha/beta hydrolase [Siculibacillus sp.]
MRPRIVFLPGLLCDAEVFAAQMAALAPVAEVAVADFTGCGSIEAMARLALARFDGPISLVGFSMGGRAALEAVRIAPQRVERLVLMDTGAGPARDGEAAGRMELVELARRDGMRALAARWLPPMVHADREADPTLIGPITAMVARMDAAIFERQIRALLGRPDARPGLAAIRCPTLVVVGRQDRWSPLEQNRELAETVPGARLAVIEDSGHFSPVERPEAVAEVLVEFFGAAAAGGAARLPETPRP